LIYVPIGTGPYKLTENENNMIKLNVNDKYFDKRANIDEYNIYIFKTKKALLNAVKSKKIDFIFDIDIDIPDLEKLEFDTGNRQILIFNARSRFFSNIVYRKKFIDSVKNIFNNNDYTIYKESPDIKYDCLSEIKDKKIKKTSLRLLISENNEFLYKMAKDISNYWSKKGIIIKIIKKPPSEILYFMKRGLKSDFVLIDWQNFSNTSFKNFFKNEKNIFNINSSLDKEVDFLREIFCNYHSYIISKSISYIYFNKKIKNIKFKKNKLNNPIYWYISE
jgi:MarR-like DNA-binding transcriptional regulator SgrR of sgrS sRNA